MSDSIMSEASDKITPPELQQSLLIAARQKTSKEAFEQKAEAELRLIGSQIVGHIVEPYKRNAVTNTAKIWNISGFIFSKYAKGHMPQIVICEVCVLARNFKTAEINYGATRSTSCIVQHLRGHHNAAYVTYAGSSAVSDINNLVDIYSPAAAKPNNDIRAFTVKLQPDWMIPLCKLVVNKYEPLNFVEGKEFRDFVFALNPKAKIPCEQTFYGELVKRKEEMEVIIKDVVDDAEEAITTDNWTSDANETYSAFTRHFITKDWLLRSLSLDCIKHTGSSKAADIVVCIKKNCADRKIDPSAVITDCEPSMVAAGRELSSQHGGCFDHRTEIVTGKLVTQLAIIGLILVYRNIL
jgi:hypothetical protein